MTTNVDMEQIEKVFELMVKHKIENIEAGELKIKRESLKLDMQEKNHEENMKKFMGDIAKGRA